MEKFCAVKRRDTRKIMVVRMDELYMADENNMYTMPLTRKEIIKSGYGTKTTVRLYSHNGAAEPVDGVQVTIIDFAATAAELDGYITESEPGRGKRKRVPKMYVNTPQFAAKRKPTKKICRDKEIKTTAAKRKAETAARDAAKYDAEIYLHKRRSELQVNENNSLVRSSPSFKKTVTTTRDAAQFDADKYLRERPSELEVNTNNSLERSSPSFEKAETAARDTAKYDAEKYLHKRRSELEVNENNNLVTSSPSFEEQQLTRAWVSSNADSNAEQKLLLQAAISRREICIQKETPRIKTLPPCRNLKKSVFRLPAPVSRENSADLSSTAKENDTDYEKVAASTLRQLQQCQIERDKFKVECEELRTLLKTKQSETTAKQYEKDLLVAMEESLKNHIEKCVTEVGAKATPLPDPVKTGMVVLKSKICVRVKPYVNAKNAVDMRKRVNAIVEAYWSKEVRRNLYFKSVRNDVPADARIITDEEFADIREIYAEINKSSPLAFKKKYGKKTNPGSDPRARDIRKRKEDSDAELVHWISRKLIVYRSRWKAQKRGSKQFSRSKKVTTAIPKKTKEVEKGGEIEEDDEEKISDGETVEEEMSAEGIDDEDITEEEIVEDDEISEEETDGKEERNKDETDEEEEINEDETGEEEGRNEEETDEEKISEEVINEEEMSEEEINEEEISEEEVEEDGIDGKDVNKGDKKREEIVGNDKRTNVVDDENEAQNGYMDGCKLVATLTLPVIDRNH